MADSTASSNLHRWHTQGQGGNPRRKDAAGRWRADCLRVPRRSTLPRTLRSRGASGRERRVLDRSRRERPLVTLGAPLPGDGPQPQRTMAAWGSQGAGRSGCRASTSRSGGASVTETPAGKDSPGRGGPQRLRSFAAGKKRLSGPHAARGRSRHSTPAPSALTDGGPLREAPPGVGASSTCRPPAVDPDPRPRSRNASGREWLAHPSGRFLAGAGGWGPQAAGRCGCRASAN